MKISNKQNSTLVNPKPTLRDIQSLLVRVKFNPKKPGVEALLAQVQNKEYYCHRAIEAIHAKDYILAIRALLLLLWMDDNGTSKTKKNSSPRTGSGHTARDNQNAPIQGLVCEEDRG